jgi:hypothetical protein
MPKGFEERLDTQDSFSVRHSKRVRRFRELRSVE